MNKPERDKIIKDLELTNRVLNEVVNISHKLKDISVDQIESIIEEILGEGNVRALGTILNVCAINKVNPTFQFTLQKAYKISMLEI